MSWDYDDTRCFPEEYDTIEEYKLEHESHVVRGGLSSGNHGAYVQGNGTRFDAGIWGCIKWLFMLMAFIYACYITLIVLALCPPIGVLFLMGLLKVKDKIYL